MKEFSIVWHKDLTGLSVVVSKDDISDITESKTPIPLPPGDYKIKSDTAIPSGVIVVSEELYKRLRKQSNLK